MGKGQVYLQTMLKQKEPYNTSWHHKIIYWKILKKDTYAELYIQIPIVTIFKNQEKSELRVQKENSLPRLWIHQEISKTTKVYSNRTVFLYYQFQNCNIMDMYPRKQHRNEKGCTIIERFTMFKNHLFKNLLNTIEKKKIKLHTCAWIVIFLETKWNHFNWSLNASVFRKRQRRIQMAQLPVRHIRNGIDQRSWSTYTNWVKVYTRRFVIQVMLAATK